MGSLAHCSAGNHIGNDLFYFSLVILGSSALLYPSLRNSSQREWSESSRVLARHHTWHVGFPDIPSGHCADVLQVISGRLKSLEGHSSYLGVSGKSRKCLLLFGLCFLSLEENYNLMGLINDPHRRHSPVAGTEWAECIVCFSISQGL